MDLEKEKVKGKIYNSFVLLYNSMILCIIRLLTFITIILIILIQYVWTKFFIIFIQKK